jgi:hypothetical protein
MAKTAIKQVSYSKAIIDSKDHHTKIIDETKTSTLKNINYSISKVKNIKHSTEIVEKSNKANVIEMLPFRVRFKTIGIPGYSSNNPAPIGIAVIGLNNYIL